MTEEEQTFDGREIARNVIIGAVVLMGLLTFPALVHAGRALGPYVAEAHAALEMVVEPAKDEAHGARALMIRSK
jgi:hypothetical protein